MAGDDRDVRGGRIAPRVGGVEAVDVGQQHQLVGLDHLGDARGQAVVVAEADLGGRHGVVLVDHRDAAEAEQRVQRGARVEVAAAVLGVVQRQQQLRGGQTAARTAPRSRPAPGGSGRRRRRPASPPAAAAAACRPSERRASAMAPEETTITSVPRARSAAMSAATPSSQAVRGAASSSSTTRALPILTTSRWAAARADGSAGRHARLLLPRRVVRSRVLQRAQHLRHALAGHAGQQHDRPARALCAAPPRAPRPRAASSRRPCSAPISSGLSASPPP